MKLGCCVIAEVCFCFSNDQNMLALPGGGLPAAAVCPQQSGLTADLQTDKHLGQEKVKCADKTH